MKAVYTTRPKLHRMTSVEKAKAINRMVGAYMRGGGKNVGKAIERARRKFWGKRKNSP